MKMLTPPYHFSTVACPSSSSSSSSSTQEVLYRGSIPANRNLLFLRQLRLRTIIILRKKALKEDDPLVRWSAKRNVELLWVKAEEMGEEKLGMGKSELGQVLKTILNPTSYPLYIADVAGISHTTLIVACLRKLQGWSMESIINEICRFEPDHEDLPLVSFITSYLSPTITATGDTFVLPTPPYPSWLWPPSTPSSSTSSSYNNQVKSTQSNVTNTSTATTAGSTSNSMTGATNARDRSISTSIASPSNSLPFPHPLTNRKHPTMKLVYPPLPLPPAPLPLPSIPLPPTSTSQGSSISPADPLSRVSSRRSVLATSSQTTQSSQTEEGIIGSATNLFSSVADIISSSISVIGTGTNDTTDNLVQGTNRTRSDTVTTKEKEKERTDKPTDIPSSGQQSSNASASGSTRLGRQVSFHDNNDNNNSSNLISPKLKSITMSILSPSSISQAGPSISTSPSDTSSPNNINISRQITRSSSSSGTNPNNNTGTGTTTSPSGAGAGVYSSESSSASIPIQELPTVFDYDHDPGQHEEGYFDQSRDRDDEKGDQVEVEDGDQDEDEEEYEEEDDDEEEEEEDEEDVQITSQYISALDLAGFG